MAEHQPAERILNLAAYAREREGSTLTLGDIVEEVPGYEMPGGGTLLVVGPRVGDGPQTTDTRHHRSP